MLSNSWLSWENPVAIWWFTLTIVSFFNCMAWIWTYAYYHHSKSPRYYLQNKARKHAMLLLSFFYVFGCAFRSILPRADVQRICLWDTWFSNVFVGRSVATIAELSFVGQWAILLFHFSSLYSLTKVRWISLLIVPLIFLAECFSWYGVITTNYLGNTVEESIWTLTYILIAIGLFKVSQFIDQPLKFAVYLAIFGCVVYVGFMVSVDVPMYFNRWVLDSTNQKVYLDLWSGLKSLLTDWRVIHDISDWKEEIPWMTAYFTAAVWTSILLCYVPLTRKTR